MAHTADEDANFYNGRLRLTTFLRVVENMPQRPSRFKRRLRTSNEKARKVSGGPVRDNEHQEAETMLVDQPWPSHLPVPLDAAATISDRNAHVRSGHTKVNTASQPDAPLLPPSQFDFPRSPPPADSILETSDNHVDVADDADDGLAGLNEARSIKTPKGTRKEPEVTTLSKPRVSKNPGESSSTRKRRLPVNGLALLRTTTAVGLPEPSDAEIIFAAPIADVDPIQDSQMNAAYARSAPLTAFQTRNGTSTRSSAAGISHQPRSQNTYPVQQLRYPLSKAPNPALPVRPKQTMQPSPHFVADGFVGDELLFISTRKPRRRGKIEPRGAKSKPTVAALTLAKGSLPAPILQLGLPSAAKDARAAPLRVTVTKGRYSDDTNTPGHLVFTRTQCTADDLKPQQQQQVEECVVRDHSSAIRTQLSSITAPMRRESESSVSEEDSESDRQTSYDAENDDLEEAAHPSTHPNARTTFVGDSHGYFEAAMHGLDIVKAMSRDKQEFWSQRGL